jgi:dCTP deaminase
MAIVNKAQIKKRLALRVEDKRQLVITPLLERDEVFKPNADSDSIDLRLGNHFLLPRIPPLPYTLPSNDQLTQSHLRVQVPFGKFLVLPAHQTVLGATLEFVKLPADLCGQILTKSSVARTFMVIETAPWIHPGYRGCLTLEIANVSNTPLILYPGRQIGQLILMELSGETEIPKQLSGKYIAPVYPEPPVFEDPKQELKRIGVPDADFQRP